MKQLTVKELAEAAGVTVRTLHVYDKLGLLKPSLRTEKNYRYYGRDELLRLQQILFYKELGLPLADIGEILDAPGFDLAEALESHKTVLQQKQADITSMIATIDKTILNLKGQMNMTHEELYAGLPREQAAQWRKEAHEKWPEQVKHSEQMLMKMNKAEFDRLQADFKQTNERLAKLMHEDPASDVVQQEIAQHYQSILKFWGKPEAAAEAYKGLGQLYVADERYCMTDGKPNAALARFLHDAMHHYADKHLK